MIRDVNPYSSEYTRNYRAGYRAGERASDGALERGDARGVTHAWYDGYMDAAAGRPYGTYRVWRRKGCDSTCADDCPPNRHQPKD